MESIIIELPGKNKKPPVKAGGLFYFPCPLYLDTGLSFGPLLLAALPPLRLPKVTFLASLFLLLFIMV